MIEEGNWVRLITDDFGRQGKLAQVARVWELCGTNYTIEFKDGFEGKVTDENIELAHLGRGFEKCKGWENIAILPVRKTSKSAGYDFCIPKDMEDIELIPGETIMIKSGIKAYMQDDEYLSLYIRSSIGIKQNVILPNCTGIIDADFYNNVDNEGNITIALRNNDDVCHYFKSGDAICQGIFIKYLTVDFDKAKDKRNGGIGSTTK
jgi:dUTP pyrophosphatase